MANIGRKRKKNGFTQISNTMLEDERLSWRAKGILSYMLSRPDNWKINKTDLYKKGKEGRDAMQNALNELKELGYLHIYSVKDDKGQIETWIWEYDDMPFLPTILKNQMTEKPQETGQNVEVSQTTENPLSGEPTFWDSSTYNNTDLNNTDYNNNKSKEIKKELSISPKMLENEFDQLWNMYPRKIGRKKACDAFKKARKVKKIPYETIQNGLYRYLRYLEQQETEEQFIMHGSTWFNQEKWQDEYITTGIKKKPKNALEYFRQKYEQEGDCFEPNRDRTVINNDSELLSSYFQGFQP